jgi:large subunit ribosomal protein L10
VEQKADFMALTKAKKAVQIDHLAHELAGSTSAIVGTFAKLTVSQDYELRKVVRGAGGRYRVLKNKLAARASQGTKVEQALQGLKGVSSVAYTSGDPVALAKALSIWMQDNAEFTFKLGIVDGHVITVEEVKQLATMPSKEAIFAKLLFLINAPAQRLVTVMNAAGRDLAVVVNQAVEKGKFAAPAPVASKPAAAVPASKPVETVETSQAAAAATEAPVEGPPVEAAPAAAPVETAPVEATAVAAVAAESAPAGEAVTETDVDSQTEAAATENPVEG